MMNNVDLPPPKVLVVDDDQKNLFAMRTALEDMPITLLEASNGEDALQIAVDNELALILLDVQMPNMDGFEIAGILNKNKQTQSIPIIFVTAISKDIKYMQKGHELGAVDYLFKPIDTTILRSKVQIFIDYFNQNKSMSELLKSLNETKKSLEKSNEQLNYLARSDVVTGLSNRFNFDEYLTSALESAKKSKQVMAVLYLDLDNFKQINDTFGHAQGDKLLMEVALRIKGSIRPTDTVQTPIARPMVSRLGGDEFALVLTDIGTPNNASIVATRILDNVKKPIDLNEQEVTVGVSIGIACYPHAGETPEKLKKAADAAMYRAKSNGKNNIEYFSDELNDQHNRFLLLDRSLKSEAYKKDISLVYQPIYNLNTKEIIAVEAFSRWKHPQLGDIPVSEFIKIAEDTGAIHKLGVFICEKIVAEIEKLHQYVSSSFKIHVNVSIKQLESNTFVNMMKKLLAKSSFNAENVIFELSETALIRNNEKIKQELDSLYMLGYSLSIDDFGTGYSSLGRIKDLPVKSVKLDRKFISKGFKDPKIAIIVKSMVHLAHDLELESIAEGIETEDQNEHLKNIGCDCGQGFYHSKPLPLDTVIDLVKLK